MSDDQQIEWHIDDPDWVDSLFTRMEKSVRTYVRSKIGDKLRSSTSSDDLVQNVLLSFWQYLPKFEYRSERELAGLLNRMALHTVQSAGSKTSREILSACLKTPGEFDSSLGAFEFTALDRSPSSICAVEEEKARLYVGLGLLKLHEQQLIALRRFVGRSWKEIAEVMEHNSEDSARVATSRAELRLTKIMFELERGNVGTALEISDRD